MSIGRGLKRRIRGKNERTPWSQDGFLVFEVRTMEKAVFEMFRREIKDQRELALMAREDLEKALREFDEAYKRGLTEAQERPYILRIWQFIHAFLVMAANISILLDPIEPTRPRGYPKKVWKIKGPELWTAMNERGIELRKFFSIM